MNVRCVVTDFYHQDVRFLCKKRKVYIRIVHTFALIVADVSYATSRNYLCVELKLGRKLSKEIRLIFLGSMI